MRDWQKLRCSYVLRHGMFRFLQASERACTELGSDSYIRLKTATPDISAMGSACSVAVAGAVPQQASVPTAPKRTKRSMNLE